MRGLFYIFLLVIMVGAVSCSGRDSDIQKDPTIKVCTYNLWCAHSRTKFISSQSDIDQQRYWKPSSCAMLSTIRDLDCDIFAFQEIGDSIYGKKGIDTSLKKLLGGGMSGSYGLIMMARK